MDTKPAVHRYSSGVRHGPPIFFDPQRRAGLLASSMQETLDRITCFAGGALNVPAVCASLVTSERRLLTSTYGLPVPTALLVSHAFRRHLEASRPLVVADGRRDPLVAHNPLVRDGTVRACLGMPLGTVRGRQVGTLLAMDRRPRRWTAPQLDLLGQLSALIVNEIELGADRLTPRADAGLASAPGLWCDVEVRA
jgi:GAF domain-containing protein